METQELTVRKTLALDTLEQLNAFGKVMVESGMFPDLKSQAQAIVKMVAGRELGFEPLYSLQHVNVIEGKTGIDAGAMAALIQKSGIYGYRVLELTDQKCKLEMSCRGKSLGIVEFTMDDARKAGLAEKVTWKKYPKNLLFARCISNGGRWYCPHVIGGAYIQEELRDGTSEELDAQVEIIEVEPVVEESHSEPMTPETWAKLKALSYLMPNGKQWTADWLNKHYKHVAFKDLSESIAGELQSAMEAEVNR